MNIKNWWNQQHHNRKTEIKENARLATQWLTAITLIAIAFVFIGSGFDG
jgi:hypothetical protein